MPPKPQGPRALTVAERQARHRVRRDDLQRRMIEALMRIQNVQTAEEARKIAAEVLTK